MYKTSKTTIAGITLLVLGGFAFSQEISIKIANVAATSGPLTASGKAIENGARLAIEDLNAQGVMIGGRKAKFQLIAEDDAGDPKQATAVAQKLTDSNINAVVGHQTSGTSIPASRIYSAAGVPQVSVTATNPKYTRQGYSTTFRLIADDVQLGKALAKFATTELKGKVFAVIDDRTAYGQGIADEFVKAASASGGTIARREYTHDKATDLSAILTNIKAAKPDIIFFGGMYSVAGPMIKQIKQLGLTAKVIGGDGICAEELLKLAGEAIGERQVFCGEAAGLISSQVSAIEKWNERYNKRYGMSPELFAPNAYDAVNALATAMVKAGSPEPAKYLPIFAATDGYKGITGTIGFDERGDIKNGTITLYTFTPVTRQKITVIQ